jgi:PAS domain S-box-containing protein
MSGRRLHILLIEDEWSHAELIRRSFTQRGEDVRLTIAHSLREAETVIRELTPDLVITDLVLPDGSGIDFISSTLNSLCPAVVMTSHGDEQIAVEAIKAGALDYVVKTNTTLADLPRIAERAVREWSHIVERQQAEWALRESEQRFRGVVEQSADGIVLADELGVVVEWNRAAEEICALSRTEALGKPLLDIFLQLAECGGNGTQERDALKAGIVSFLRTGKAERINQPDELTILLPDGSQRIVQFLLFPIETDRGFLLGSILRNMTENRQAEQLMRQQDRLAAVGQLAAGIAHDFNNIIAVIVLYTQTSLLTPNLTPQVRDRLETVVHQAQRAAELIEQILDFSRRTVLERRPLNLLSLLKEQVKLLKRTVPENINIDLLYGSDFYAVTADPTRIQQAVMNLVLNARDAMPGGGKLTIALDKEDYLTGDRKPLPDISAGEWVRLSIADTGSGIDEEIFSHLFEPFFTTKYPGKRTGLGLAQVYGIVKQHEGHVDVTTELGKGTVFTIYLPALENPKPKTAPLIPRHLPQGSGETILVIEDNDAAREALADSLEMLNYSIVAVANGREALAMLEQAVDDVALILSDIVMPEMGGIALMQELRGRGDLTPIILMSGHPQDEEFEDLGRWANVGRLTKPANVESLARLVFQMVKADQR